MKIVAPAGNMERFYAAVKAGAQEIYMGLKGFGARRNAENFTLDEYKEALDYAHKRGVKIFLTLNTVMMENEMEFLYQNVKVLYEHGLDAVIVQDLGYFRFLKENFPDMEYHGSTQMTVANHYEAEYLRKIGFTRVVLPREMTFEEIKKIRENTKIELEIFVSGALCICYSGNCYLSSFVGSRSGNRGMCAQPCRKPYTTSSGEKGYMISPKDQLLGFEEIKKLKDIGIESIKIEGRMKDPKYVFEAVSYYKNLIDENRVEENVSEIFNRGYSKGYFYGNDEEKIMNKNFSFNLGKNIGLLNGKKLKLTSNLMLGDGIIYLSREYEKLGGGYINKIELENGKSGNKIAFPGDTIILKDVPRGSKYVFKSYAKEVNDEAERKIKQGEQSLGIEGTFLGKLGEYPQLTFTAINNMGEKISVIVKGDKLVEVASKKSLDYNEIKDKIGQLGDTTYFLKELLVDIDDSIFIPVSVLKSLKRECAEKLDSLLVESYRRKSPTRYSLPIEKEEERKVVLSAIVNDEIQEKVAREFGIDRIYKRGIDIAKEGNLEWQDLNSRLASNLYQLLENKNNNVITNWNLNITNRYTVEELYKIGKLETVILSPELSFEKIKSIGKTSARKAILGYSKLKGMYIELELFSKTKEILKNTEDDNFTAIKNKFGNTEIFLEKPLNILNDLHKLSALMIDEVVLEFSYETEEEVRNVFSDMQKKTAVYRAYNYERGVY